MRLNSLDDFERHVASLTAEQDASACTLVIPAGTCGRASGADELISVVRRTVDSKGLADRVHVRITGCHGFCEMEPSILVMPSDVFYPKLRAEDGARIVEAAARGETVTDLLWIDSIDGSPIPRQRDIPFFKTQQRTILARNERVVPGDISSYLADGGYGPLVKALRRNTPTWALEEVKASGLRGRGGAGFPTGMKWEMLAKQPTGHGKYMVCNADEGDPGAYMDRSVLEGNPHSVIEGMLIGAYATGATDGIIYIRAEYPLAIDHLLTALEQARALGLLGAHILGTDFSFDIEVVEGAGAFVCGEETALIRSIEGKMGEPKQRPPFPIQQGINGKPTSINNVETWANIPVIIGEGADRYARVGTERNAGTKIFSLVGKIKHTGLVEAPMGMTIKQIVYDIGGGAVGKGKIKAVQTGGPSGGCIPAKLFDLAIDYDSLAQVGAIMGSGGMIVMDEGTCMVDIAKYFVGFLKGESCGKCFTCRKGTQRMYELLDDITNGRGTPAHLELLEELARVIKDTTMCGLGQTAANPVLSTLRYFRHEYERHVLDNRCDAFVCAHLTGASCQTACPVDTPPWRYVALIEQGELEAAYNVIREANPLPGVSARVCDRECERHCKLGATGGEPIAIRTLKRFVTDRVAPQAFTPRRITRLDTAPAGETPPSVAIVGTGPAGLAAAHYLSLCGRKVTLIEAEAEPGGMLMTAIPPYRLPRDVARAEVKALLDENITLRCGVKLGRDITIDDLFEEGHGAVFLALGAHKSWPLGVEGETLDGVYSSIEFLRAFNLHGEQWGRGRVGIIGGGNSAVDAARVALRQETVDSVMLLYRRTCDEMPAYAEEVDAAIEEGIRLETLVSPVRIRYIEAAMKEGVQVETFVSPVKIESEDGHLAGIECVRNNLGDVDASGRRKPVPIPGSEFHIALDTLIVAIGERPDSDCLESMGLSIEKDGRLEVNPKTFATSRKGVFAGGDLTTGPNTVVGALAAGKQAAISIDRYLQGLPMETAAAVNLPDTYLAPPTLTDADEEVTRITPPTLPAEERKTSFAEVESSPAPEDALREARRCMRCDLQFTCALAETAEATGAEQ